MEGLHTPLEGLHTPLEGLQTPLEGLQTPLERLRTPFEGLQTPLEGLQTPLKEIRTPLEGLHTSLNPHQNPFEDCKKQKKETCFGDIKQKKKNVDRAIHLKVQEQNARNVDYVKYATVKHSQLKIIFNYFLPLFINKIYPVFYTHFLIVSIGEML